jgi:hypothetical protein
LTEKGSLARIHWQAHNRIEAGAEPAIRAAPVQKDAAARAAPVREAAACVGTYWAGSSRRGGNTFDQRVAGGLMPFRCEIHRRAAGHAKHINFPLGFVNKNRDS